MTGNSEFRYPIFSKRIIVIVGGFGSGKTEVSVNLAKYLKATQKSEVTIVDLDLVNPYFRSREAIDEISLLGINTIAPRGGQFFADLPILLPEVKGVIENNKGLLILDVGGDAQGAKALGSLAGLFETGTYEMLLVINSRRPRTSDVNGCLETKARIEGSSRLKFTGLIANSHLLENTDREVLLEGHRLAGEVTEKTGLPLIFLSGKENVLRRLEPREINCPVLPLTRSMLKPWERKEKSGGES